MTAGAAGAAFTARSARAALVLACHQAGLDAAGASLLRLGENAIYALPGPGLVARIARSARLRERVEREVAVAGWLAERDFPAVRLAGGVPQVVAAAGRLATFWQLVPATGQPTYAEFGAVLARLHALPEPPLPLPAFDPFTAVPARLASPGTADPADVAYLADLHHRLTAAYRELAFPTPPGLIHGDAHLGNVLLAVDHPLLADFEAVAYGPREWDLTPTAMARERFGLPERDYRRFVAAYGRDVTGWSGYPTLRAVRELTTTTWLLQNVTASPLLAAEFRLRVASLREPNPGRRWHPC